MNTATIILIVDDSEIIADYFQYYLSNYVTAGDSGGRTRALIPEKSHTRKIVLDRKYYFT